MWSTNAMAIYSGQAPPVSVQPKALPKTSTSSKRRPSTGSSSRKPSLSSSSGISSSMSVPDFFEPAVDRPPSPARLRQLSKQMKRASHLRRQSGHRVGASASSSLTSLNSDFPGLEQALDNVSLARQSSTRSTDSSVPEVVYGFGKTMFHRRRKSKRESSANSSSASSLHSPDSPADNPLATGSKESFMPALFSRRKGSRDDATRRKVQISGPYNFQHVTHTDRESVPAAQQQHANRSEQGPDLLTMRATGPSPNISPNTVNALDIRDFPNPSEVNARQALTSRHAVTSGPQRLMRRIRSQDQLRGASVASPPRPPRSPTQQTPFQSFSPVPPPRVSSRQGLYQDGSDQFAIATQERPKTSGGFWRPSPYSPTTSLEHLPPATFVPRPSTPTQRDDLDIESSAKSPVQPPPNDPAWPLASPTISYDTSLPDVPEEEEHFNTVRRSRLSLVSNASLRPSQSVPMLRSLAKVQRPISGASETLGYFDIAAAQQVVAERLEESHTFNFEVIRESWEDDIDYCYEHEAEATCDYQWERCSLDTARDSNTLLVDVTFSASEPQVPIGTAESSPGMLSVSRFDVPGLIPGNRASTATGHEAITPTSNPTASNFSLPLIDKRHLRASHASSFKESHGFTLSPSLLIPGDFHHQLLLSEGSRHEYPEDEEFMTPFQASYDETVSHINKPTPWFQRSSTSTTGTNSTGSRSDSTGDRHISGMSSWSFQTRHTTSSTSLNKMAGSLTEETEPIPAVHLTEEAKNEEQDAITIVSQDTVPELIPFPSPPARKASYHKSHASESLMYDDISPSIKSVEAAKRRSRARTTSMSNQAPPVGQYALFPRSYIKPSGDRI